MASWSGAEKSLTFRIAVLLALAILPIGLVSVSQTISVNNEARAKERENLIALTAEASDRQAAYTRTALGAAQSLAAVVPALRENGWDCEDTLSDFLANSPIYTFIGYVDVNGTLVCGSEGEGINVFQSDLFQDQMAEPRPRVSIDQDAPASHENVMIVSAPVMRGGEFDGMTAVSLLHRSLYPETPEGAPERPFDLMIFDNQGKLIGADPMREDIAQHLPRDEPLSELARSGETFFVGRNLLGDRRVFSSVPIIPGAVYALGSWDAREISTGPSLLSALLFPLLMWAAGLGVAFYAIQTMVIRPTRDLRARMLMFMRSRKIVPLRATSTTPREFVEMDETWQLLAESVLRDEAELHNSIHEKTVLLKEVHHRVKNNLQLIASIVNMKLRKVETPEAKQVLRNIQHRVMSIVRVHRNLYETTSHERVRMDELLDGIVGDIVASGLSGRSDVVVERKTDPITLYPDQAVPLSLAVSEMMTNAMKYLSMPDGETARLRFALERLGEARARVTVENTYREGFDPEDTLENSTGLGSKLLLAFADQVGGELVAGKENGRFRAVIEFPIFRFQEMEAEAPV